MTDQLVVFARIVPKAEHFDDARNAIAAIVEQTRAESGCRTFTLLEGKAGENALYLYEIWHSEEDLVAHYEQPYTKAVFARYESWLEKPVEITKMEQIA